MQRSSERMAFNEGTDVVAADGVEVGDVVLAHDTYFVVGARIASTIATLYYLPTSIVERLDGASVWLSVTRDEALAKAPFRGWPTSDGHTRGDRADMQRSTTNRDTTMTEDDAPVEHHQESARTHRQVDASINVRVREEKLNAPRREVDYRSVRVENVVVTEEVEIGKEAVESTERVSDTVRREEVRVDDTTTGGGRDRQNRDG